MLDSYKKRDSGIELLRIIAIFLIVLAHVVQTLGKTADFADFNFPMEFGTATTSVNLLLISLFRHGGHIGTIFFFVISVFFLVDNEKWNNRKAIRLWFEIIFISYVFFIVYMIIRKGNIESEDIFNALCPVISYSTWYLTFYLVVLLLSPLLNKLFKRINKYIVLGLGIILMIVGMLFHNSISQAFSFPGIYCLIYFLKHNHSEIFESKRINVALFLIGLVLFLAIFFGTNAIGLLYPDMEVDLLWQVNYGNIPFYFMAFGLLNLFRKIRFKNSTVNYLASITLVCYIVHENVLFRTYTRPEIWEWIYNSFTLNNVALKAFIFAACLFVASFIVGIIYNLVIQKLIVKLSNFASDGLFKLFTKPRNKIMNKKIQEN